MKKWLILLIVMLPALVGFSQDSVRVVQHPATVASDSLHVAGGGAAGTTSDDERWLPYLMIIVAIGFTAVVVIGVMVSLFLCGVAVVLTIAGILSASVIIGFYKRSLKAGVRWAIYLFFAAGGAGAGVLSYLVFLIVRKIHFNISTPVLVSAGAGLIGGLICGAVFLFMLRRTAGILQSRLGLVKKIF